MLFFAKKEVFEWLAQGRKTIDIRKGKPRPGEIAIFQCGPKALKMSIQRKESGRLLEVLRLDNYRAVIPSAESFADAVGYLKWIYGDCEGTFTAYYVLPLV